MTTVRHLRLSTSMSKHVAGKVLWALPVWLALGSLLEAQTPPVHWLHAGAMPPGAIGRQRLLRGGPLSGYFQPVEIRAPQGTQVSAVCDGEFTDAGSEEALVGMLVGHVYRLRLRQIPNLEGVELFPTVELIDRLYPPPGKALEFPIPIELTAEELAMAARGMLVTRVIYVEDPDQALPVAQSTESHTWFEARPVDDPLVVADSLGRPIAILRIGSRYPSEVEQASFVYGAPPLQLFPKRSADSVQPPPPPALPPQAHNPVFAR